MFYTINCKSLTRCFPKVNLLGVCSTAAVPQKHDAGVKLADQKTDQISLNANMRYQEKYEGKANEQTGYINKEDIHNPAHALKDAAENSVYIHKRAEHTQGSDVSTCKRFIKDNITKKV